MREVNGRQLGERVVELEARLFATSVNPDELDRVLAALRQLHGVHQAFWSGSSDD